MKSVLPCRCGTDLESVPPPLSDAEYYDAAARSLAGGDGYSVLLTPEGFRPGGESTAFYPPGYSIFLGAGYAIFGENVAAGRALNAVAFSRPASIFRSRYRSSRSRASGMFFSVR